MAETKSIKEYFRGKNIFLTGGSGFLGKPIIEKLLRSCPDINIIYILLRPKKGKSLNERLNQITSSHLFEKLRQNNPDNIKKIIPMHGDAAKLGLGLSEEDKQVLIENVHVVFHVAASVKFDDFLKDAIFINVRSAREAALLALEMKQIEVFIHVSTTYCNIHKKEVEEILYPSQGNWREAINIAETCENQTLNVLSRKYIDYYPNTYTYTKLLGEHCVNDLLVGKLPTVICRPSVVIPSIADPFQGWVDNVNGPVGLLLAGGSGLLRTVYGDPTVNADYMAVDNVVKLIIIAGWHKANIGEKDQLSVYHSSKYKKLSFKQAELVELGKILYWAVPFEKKIWFPGNSMTKCWYNYFFNVILFHIIPAVFLDLVLRVAGYPPILLKIQRKIYIANLAVSPFMLNEWHFRNTRAIELFNDLTLAEREEFNFLIYPVGSQSIYEYYLTSTDYARRYIMKEYKDITTETRIRTTRMYYLDRLIKFLFVCLTVWLVLFKVNVPKLVINILCNYWNSL